MSRPRTVEANTLAPIDELLARHVAGTPDETEARAQILEAAASRIGGFALRDYHALRGVQTLADTERHGAELVRALAGLPIPPPLALAALARPRRSALHQRRTGAWYTDWRLATWLASALRPAAPGAPPRLLDPACGSGILLVAAVRQLAPEPRNRARLVGDGVCGADLDADALRGAALALASLTSDLGAIASMLPRLRQADALLHPFEGAFDVIVGNPPWERLRLTRHEHRAELGAPTHYGDATHPAPGIDDARAALSGYVATLRQAYDLQGTGDPDLYKLFTELALRLLADDGQLAWLLPGGILRSQGTAPLRRRLLDRCGELRWTVLDNRARFFAVDTRQKVVLVQATLGVSPTPLQIRHADGAPDGVRCAPFIALDRSALARLRDDLAIPEVRSDAEWALYTRLARAGRVADWQPTFLREVDMSLQRGAFLSAPAPGALPLLEGRMVHQYRHDAKRYVSGTGRAARWDPPDGPCAPRPQHWIPVDALSEAARQRSSQDRVGFCDITGQTNERSMLAALIPAGVACGNKVPTVCFDAAQTAWAWIAIANSLVFDWALRRNVTTTVNLFLLRDLPWPALDPAGPAARRLADLARQLGACAHHPYERHAGGDPWATAELRARVEVEVAHAWDLDEPAVALVLADFPLLDRACPPLPGEPRSTITRDLVLLRLSEARGEVGPRLRDRVEAARALGAVPFVPSHLAGRQAPISTWNP